MRKIKVLFIGNPLAGDDGIGMYLFNELKEHPDLQDYELIELGSGGFDILSYLDRHDDLIIVDSVRSEDGLGDVILLGEEDLSIEMPVITPHDLGIEHAAAILRAYKPDIKSINIIGIRVKDINCYDDSMSENIMQRIDEIKLEVLSLIKDIGNRR